MTKKPNDSEVLRKKSPRGPKGLTPSGPSGIAELTAAVERLTAVLENGLAQVSAALVSGETKVLAKPQRPLARGDRVKAGNAHGTIASVGAAGVGVKWDGGRYDMLLHPQAARLVRE